MSYNLIRLGDKLHALGYPYYFNEAPVGVTDWRQLRDIIVYCEDTVIRALPQAERAPLLHNSENEKDFVANTLPQYLEACQANQFTRAHIPSAGLLAAHLDTIRSVQAAENVEGETDADRLQREQAAEALRAEAKAKARPFLGFGVRSKGGAILTENIKAGGPAFRAGLQVDEKVVEICDTPFRLVEEAKKLVMSNAKVGNIIKLKIEGRPGGDAIVNVPVCTQDEKYKELTDLFIDTNAAFTSLSSVVRTENEKFDKWLDHECPARSATVALVESVVTAAVMLTVVDGQQKKATSSSGKQTVDQEEQDADAAATAQAQNTDNEEDDDDDDEPQLTWSALKQAHLQWAADHGRRLISSVEQPSWKQAQEERKKANRAKKNSSDDTSKKATQPNIAELKKILREVARNRAIGEGDGGVDSTTADFDTFIENGNLVRTLRSLAIINSAREARAKQKAKGKRVYQVDVTTGLEQQGAAAKLLSSIHLPDEWMEGGANTSTNKKKNDKKSAGAAAASTTNNKLTRETTLRLFRLAFTQDLRALQDTINEGIGELQDMTATCKTDARLGRVGS